MPADEGALADGFAVDPLEKLASNDHTGSPGVKSESSLRRAASTHCCAAA